VRRLHHQRHQRGEPDRKHAETMHSHNVIITDHPAPSIEDNSNRGRGELANARIAGNPVSKGIGPSAFPSRRLKE
jgi:hypothetical protein